MVNPQPGQWIYPDLINGWQSVGNNLSIQWQDTTSAATYTTASVIADMEAVTGISAYTSGDASAWQVRDHATGEIVKDRGVKFR